MANWLSFIALVAAAIGALFFAVRSPAVWTAIGWAVWKMLLPIILKRMPPEEEAAWRKRVSRGEPDQPERGHRER